MAPARRRALDLLPGYPGGYESVVRLADGRRVKVRPVLPSDAAELAEAIRSADAETLHARFLGGPPPLTKATLETLTRLDYVNQFALVARSRGHGVGIARYVRLPPAEDGPVEAEVAVAVTPEWRRIGLATALIELLARRALECDITHFTALFQPNNRPVTELARDGEARVVIAEGAAQLYAALATLHEKWPSSDRSGNARQKPHPGVRNLRVCRRCPRTKGRRHDVRGVPDSMYEGRRGNGPIAQ